MNRRYVKVGLGILQAGLTLAVVILLLLKAHTLRDQIVFSATFKNISLVCLSVMLFILFYLVMSCHWLMAVRIFKPDSHKKLILSFFASQPYKYLPTSLFSFSFRSKFAKDQGISVVNSAKAQLIENGNMIASGFLCASLALVFIYNYALGLVIVCMVAALLYAVSKSSYTASIRLSKNNFSLQPKKVVPLVALALAGWVIAGLALWVLGLATTGSVDALQSVAANSLAFSASILAVFAPGGVGVREYIYAYFGVGVTVIVMWRLLTLVLDIVLGFVAALKIAHLKRRS